MSNGRTALVLGGGGITGIAWEVGLVAGLADAGVDLRTADLVVGTSAGSVVGAQLRSATPIEDLLATQLGSTVETGPPARLGRRQLLRFALAMLRTRGDDVAFRRRVGALALAAEAAGDTPTEEARRAAIASRLPETTWPERPLTVTAVDAATGAFEAFTRDSGVDLVSAVAASCAVPGVYPPTTIGDRRFLDGGMRSVANVDLALGYDRIVVVAPIVRGVGPMVSVDAQVAGLVSRVTVVSPDADSVRAIGKNVLDPAAREPSAQAGRAQAVSVAERVREVWLD